jgi:fimbrial chaperone protein
MHNKTLRRVFLGTACLLLAGILHAGSVDVAPVNALLSADHAIQGFTIHNGSQSPETVQVSLMSWRQENGKDVYTPADDLLATPPLFTVLPGKMQMLRVGMRHVDAKPTEGAYRMFLTEVPPPPQPGFTGLAVTFRLSIPIFVKPAKDSPAELAWQLHKGADNKLQIEVTNSGASHVKIIHLALKDLRTSQALGNENTLLYVLGNQYRRLDIAAKGDVRVGDQIQIQAKTAHGDLSANAAVQSG